MKVLIVGAGPTGLTAALEFARRGIIPEVVDAKVSPSELSRAVGILPESIEKLRTTGAGDRILKEGVRFERLKIHYNNKTAIDLDVSRISGSKSLPVLLPQDRTEAIMSDTLKKIGGRVKYNHKVVDIKTNQKKASVTFSNGETKKYDWVIGADGVNSTVREKLGIRYLGYELEEVWSIADIELKEEPSLEALFWIIGETEKDIVLTVPIGPKRVRLVSSTPDSVKVLPTKLNIENIRRVGTFKISIRQAETYLKGKVLLAGDSAHAFSPVGGRGMNLGIADAVEVVKSILNGKTYEYSIERRKMGKQVIRATERARKILVSKNPLTQTFLKSIFFLIQHSGFFRKSFVQKLINL